MSGLNLPSTYLEPIFHPKRLKRLIKHTAKVTKQAMKEHDANALAFCGTSGAAMAFPLSALLKVPLIHVRKENLSAHAALRVEGCEHAFIQRYMIVDDFMESGETVQMIVSEIEKRSDSQHEACECVGVILYLESQARRELKRVGFMYNKQSVTVPLYQTKVD